MLKVTQKERKKEKLTQEKREFFFFCNHGSWSTFKKRLTKLLNAVALIYGTTLSLSSSFSTSFVNSPTYTNRVLKLHYAISTACVFFFSWLVGFLSLYFLSFKKKKFQHLLFILQNDDLMKFGTKVFGLRVFGKEND